jgi:hypothetical protein
MIMKSLAVSGWLLNKSIYFIKPVLRNSKLDLGPSARMKSLQRVLCNLAEIGSTLRNEQTHTVLYIQGKGMLPLCSTSPEVT